MRIVILGVEDLLWRLPETLAGAHTEVIVVGPPGSFLRNSDFVSSFIALTPVKPADGWYSTVVHHARMLAQLDADWYFLGSDGLAAAIAQSDLPVDIKLRLLPTRGVDGLALMGSKVGLAETMVSAGLDKPKTVVIEKPHLLAPVLRSSSLPVMVKANIGRGGTGVVRLTSAEDADIPETWFPVVVQDFIAGRTISVEALFMDGRLLGWLYSEALAYSAPNGPSSIRRFVDPPSRDFETLLNRVGAKAKLEGFFNCSLMWNESKGSHFLFEVDPRPNAWFQFGPQLGVDWAALMRGEDVPHSPVLPHRGTVIHLYPRSVSSAWRRNQPWRVLPWVLRVPGTYAARNWRDSSVNERERMLVRRSMRHSLLRIPIAAYRRLPDDVRHRIQRSRFAGILRKISG